MSPHNVSSVAPANGSVKLQPFPHQVAGQSLILRYDVNTICKSVIPRERQFYLTRHESLRPFVPEYRGLFHLHLPSHSPNIAPDTAKENSNETKTENDNSSSYSLEPQTDAANSLAIPEIPVLVGGSSLVNPDNIRGLHKSSSMCQMNGMTLYEFLLLEDVISKFENPNVLDLKIGTRQHGDDAPPDKIAYQVNKCKSTTSASLGIRLCGMKKFDETTDQYMKRNKTYGRRLNDDGIKMEIADFLSSQGSVCQDVVTAILKRLKSLQTVVLELDGYRFYSCSLLIVYKSRSSRAGGDTKSECVRPRENKYGNKRPIKSWQPISSQTILEHHGSDDDVAEGMECENGNTPTEPCQPVSSHPACPNSSNGVKPDSEANGKNFSDDSSDIAPSLGIYLGEEDEKENEELDSREGDISDSCQCHINQNRSTLITGDDMNSNCCLKQSKVDCNNIVPTQNIVKTVGSQNSITDIANSIQVCNISIPDRNSDMPNQSSTETCSRKPTTSEECNINMNDQRETSDNSNEIVHEQGVTQMCDSSMNDNAHSVDNSEQDNTFSADDCVEVRVVDFANSTFPGFVKKYGGKSHTGPDRGFLVGLTTLIDILSNLQTNTNSH